MSDIIKANTKNLDFILLVKCLDAELAIRDKPDHALYAQFNMVNI